MKRNLKLVCLALGGAGMLAGWSGGAVASGFQLMEQNASGLGNAYAGTAAAAEDASTIYFNPAGMVLLKGRNLAVSGNLIHTSSEFRDRGSSFTPIPNFGVGPLTGNDGDDGGGLAFLPATYYSHAITNDLALGVSVNSPFGLKTDFDPGFIGRFQGIKSQLTVIAITPTVAYRVHETFSVGAGFRAQKASARLTSAASPLLPNSFNNLTGNDWGFGLSAGAMWQPLASTRFGVAYQSQVRHEIEGSLVSSVPGVSTPAMADVKLPDSLTFSALHQIGPKWEVLADVAWTNWSKFQELRVKSGVTGGTVSVTPENWDDTVRVSLGANYKPASNWKIRVGVAYDETPTSNRFRTVRIPDEDRLWLAFGVQYKLTPKATIDVGYAHLFVDDSKIDKTELLGAGPVGTRIVGEFDNSVNIFGAQLSYNF